MDEPSSLDQTLWELHRKGEPSDDADAAFNRLYKRHWGWLCAHFQRLVDQEAEDIVNEAFIREYLERGQMPKQNWTFKTTIYITCRNVYRNCTRQAHTRDRHSGAEIPEEDVPSGDTPEHSILSKLAALAEERGEFAALAKRLWPDFPNDHIRHVYLRMVGFSSREIAELLGITEAAERQRWHHLTTNWPPLGEIWK